MNRAFRATLSFLSFFGSYVFIRLVELLLPLGSLDLLASLISLVAAIAVARYTWNHADVPPTSVAGAVAYGVILCGGIGFAAGFFGPMIFAPGANQGPLLGIFITGPVGVGVGAVAGLVYWLTRMRRENG